MNNPQTSACSHLHVDFRTSRNLAAGETAGWWECRDCAQYFRLEALGQPQDDLPKDCPQVYGELIMLRARLDRLQGKLDRHEALFNRIARAWNGRES